MVMRAARSCAAALVAVLACVLGVTLAGELKVNNGVVVKFGPEGSMTVIDGLVVNGSATFTSANDDTRGGALTSSAVPAPGDWRGIQFERSATADKLRFDGLYVLYGGREGPACRLRETTIPLGRLFVTNSAGVAIFASAGTTSPLSDLVLRNNGVGIEVEPGANISVSSSVIDTNASAGAVNLDTTHTVPMEALWWGHPTGPRDTSDDRPNGGWFNPDGLGNGVSDGIGYVPVSPTVPLFAVSIAPAAGDVAFQRSTTFLLSGPTATAVRLGEDPALRGATFGPVTERQVFELSAGDGPKTVYAEFQAPTGNTRIVSTTLHLDSEGPALAVLQPASGAVIARPVTVRATATDPAGVDRVEFFVDDLPAGTDRSADYTYDWDVRAAGDGPHTLRVIAYDVYGHPARQDVPVVVAVVPPAPPVITSPSAGVTAAVSVPVAGTAEANLAIAIMVNGSVVARTTAAADGRWSFPSIPLVEGANQISATASDSVGSSSPSAPVAVTRDTGPPPPPSSLTVTGTSTVAQRFTWTSPGVADLATYNLYRSTSVFTSRLEATRVASNITAVSTVDQPPADGTFYYAVTATDTVGNESEISNVVSAVFDVTPPSAALACTPTGVAGPGSIALDLTLTEAVAVEPLVTATPSGGAPVAIPMTATPDPLKWQGTFQVLPTMSSGPVAFTFSARDVAGNHGSTLTANCALTLDTRAPRGTATVTPAHALAPGTYPVQLDLDEDPAQPPVLRFVPPVGPAATLALTGSLRSWQGSLVVSDAMGEGKGRFELDAIDAFGNTGSGTIPNEVTLDRTAPFPPAGLAARSFPAGRVNLTWKAVGNSTYRLYRANGNGPVDPAQPLVVGITSTMYLDQPATDGTYSYAVAAVDGAGNASAPSATVAGVSDRTPPGNPPSLALALEGTAIRATWTAPSGEAPATYRLYRSESPITSLEGFVAVQSGLTATTALDTPPRDGDFWYAVVALDVPGNASGFASAGPQAFDQGAPEIWVRGASDGEVTNRATVTLEYGATDRNLASVSATLDGAPFASGGTVDEERGYTLVVDASDSWGNASQKTVRFAIDRHAPVVQVDGVTDGAHYEQAVTPVVTVTDSHVKTVTTTLNGRPFTSGTTIATDGSYTLSARAEDEAGNVTTVPVAFSVDLPPSIVPMLQIDMPENGYPVLTWSAPSEPDVIGFILVRDGIRLTPVAIAPTTFTDSAFDPYAAHVYEVLAVDRAGHEGPPRRATLPYVGISLANYGTANQLARRYFDTVRVQLLNRGTEALANPLNLELKLLDGSTVLTDRTLATTAPLQAGATVTLAGVVSTGEGTGSTRALELVLSSTQPGVYVRLPKSFTLDVREPSSPLEIFAEPLVRGTTGHAKVKLYNRGSAPFQVRTQVANAPSPDVRLVLRNVDGQAISGGNLDQRADGVMVTPTMVIAEVTAGRSFVTHDIAFQVPMNLPDSVVLEALAGPLHSDLLGTQDLAGGTLSGSTRSAPGNPTYLATAHADKAIYTQTENVQIGGNAYDTATGAPVAGARVKVGISTRGFDRLLYATTDAEGNFTTTFTPINGEAGNYSIWATHPDVTERLSQATFDIVALTMSPTSYNLRMSQNTSVPLRIDLGNPGELPLTGFVYSVASGAGVRATIDTSSAPSRLEAGQTGRLTLTIAAAEDAALANFATLTITTAQGITRTFEVNLQLFPAAPAIRTSPTYTEASVRDGSIITRTVRISNPGYAPLTGVVLEAPDVAWMTLGVESAPTTVPVGGYVDVPVVLAPPPGLAPGYYSSRFVIKSDNHIPYVQNIFATVTSSTSGAARFEVRNTENTPLNHAHVWIQNLDVPALTQSLDTDESGIANFSPLPTGHYQYQVQAAGTQPAAGRFDVDPDTITPITPFLTVEYVTVQWSVTPVVIEDRYTVTVTATYKTDVPAPVLVANPASFDVKVPKNSVYVGSYTLKNYGLVAVDNVNVVPSVGPGATIETLVSGIERLGAMESITIPVRIRWGTSTAAQGSAPFAPPGQNPYYALSQAVIPGSQPRTPSEDGEPNPCDPIAGSVNNYGIYVCLAGLPSWASFTIPFTISVDEHDSIEKQLGLCDECDFCKVLECVGLSQAADGCKCIKSAQQGSLDICSCIGALGITELGAACECTNGGTGVDVCGCINAAGYERAGEVCECASGLKNGEFNAGTAMTCMKAVGGAAAKIAKEVENTMDELGKIVHVAQCTIAATQCVCKYVPWACGVPSINLPSSPSGGCVGCGPGPTGGGEYGPPHPGVTQTYGGCH